jgi:uncharacterized protein YerC
MVARTTFIEKAEIKSLASQGLSYRRIAAQTGKSAATVGRIVKKSLDTEVNILLTVFLFNTNANY